MEHIVDQPLPGVRVPALPVAPTVVTVVEDALERNRALVQSRFAAAEAALAAGTAPDFAAVADALLRSAEVEWQALAPVAGPARARFERWHAAQPALAAAVADLAFAAWDDEFQRALLRRRAWQYRDAYDEALGWRRRELGADAAAAN